ncbi:MAG: hypothetical protein JW902_18090 [Syntrophaceae bacterium]|nr:hypothetical protein [Syntrophaceae bacterium]
MKTTLRRNIYATGLVVIALLLSSCSSIGPQTVARDRFEYGGSIGESWKRQTLLNIVKVRYLDPPIFLDVGQIVAGYTLESTISVGGTFERNGDNLSLGGAGRYTDRPTVTYTPLTGNRFVRSLMTPLPPESVFYTIQSGWPADNVLGAAVASLNGLKNQESGITGVMPPDPDFVRVLELLRKIQLSGAVAVRIQQDAQKKHTTILTFHAKNIPQETVDNIAEVRRLLRLNPDEQEFKLVFAAAPANDRELAVLTRSLTHIMAMIAAHVTVPAEDIEAGRATPGMAHPKLRIGCSDNRPSDAFVAVLYRNRWFWIDDRDLYTKRVFAFMMLLFTLADSGDRENLPLITIPAQ